MDAATAARVVAWNIILEEDLPVGTKVIVEDGQVTIHPHGGQPAHAPYTPEDTIGSLHRALKAAVLANPQTSH